MVDIALTVSVRRWWRAVGWIGNVKIRGVGFGMWRRTVWRHYRYQLLWTGRYRFLALPTLHFIQEFGLRILFVYTIGIQWGRVSSPSARLRAAAQSLCHPWLSSLGLVTAVLR